MAKRGHVFSRYLWIVGCVLCACYPAVADDRAGRAEDGWTVLVDPANTFGFTVLHGTQTVGHIAAAGWGPNWSWAGLSSTQMPKGADFAVSAPFVVNRGAGQVIGVDLHVAKVGPRAISLRYDLDATKDVPLTLLAATVGIEKSAKGHLIAYTAGGETVLPLPINKGALKSVTKVVYRLDGEGEIAVAVDPPSNVGLDNDARLVLAEENYPAGKKAVTLNFTFPHDVALLASSADVDKFTKTLAGPDWFPFTPTNDLAGGAIGMGDWLDKPAGKRGGVRMVRDHFQLADGTPIKFWGVNLSYGSNCAPERPAATFTAARFAKYGVNAVRLHKFSYPPAHGGIGDANDSTRWDAAGLERFDYFAQQLKKNGVYFGWSHTYGMHVRPGDRARLVAYDEILTANHDGNTYAFINFAPDVQDLMIEMVVNLLRHKNPYTGLTYAQEPALSYIELQNEDDIFFWTSEAAFNSCPTYRKLFVGRFSDWLKAKYGSEEGLNKAWEGATKGGESLAERNVVPFVNPWFASDGGLSKLQGGTRQRVLDSAAFLHYAQDQFYGKFVKAIRAAGYEGPINGSPWQAPAMLPHYYNLKSDYDAGYIDRHNYGGEHLFDTMLAQPGSGYFSTGLQQVLDRPFGLSEWITVYPSLYSAEGPALVAAYGLGLQGWDASYEFQSAARTTTYGATAGNFPWGVWEADVPTQLGQYPALARMIYRGDVKEGPVISIRKISPTDLADGKFNFSDTVSQSGDVKTFGGSVPPAALAAGRVAVEFTGTPQPSTFPDMAAFDHGKVITSATKQLVWDYSAGASGQGFFTVDTDGTKAVVGFAAGKDLKLGDVRIRPDCPYASIFLTAADRAATLAMAKTALLTAVARNCNRGFRYFAPDQKVIDNGKGPILLEPVKATVTISRRGVSAVNILDHDGNRTGRTLPVHDGAFAIDGTQDKALYYEVVFE